MVNPRLNNSVKKSLAVASRRPEKVEPDLKAKTAGFPPPFVVRFSPFRARYQRRSCNTLACDWLASASAETAIDWRVDSAWLLAASSLVSASVRFDEPVCSTLIRFLLKS